MSRVAKGEMPRAIRAGVGDYDMPRPVPEVTFPGAESLPGGVIVEMSARPTRQATRRGVVMSGPEFDTADAVREIASRWAEEGKEAGLAALNALDQANQSFDWSVPEDF